MTNDDWDALPKDHPVRLAFDAGEPTPLKGMIYTCVGFFTDLRKDEWNEGYELAEFDFSKYTNQKVYFKKDRFINLGNKPEVIESSYNCSFVMEYKIKTKIPRKKKKRLKKFPTYESYTFTHER